jgi:hypothetical protein
MPGQIINDGVTELEEDAADRRCGKESDGTTKFPVRRLGPREFPTMPVPMMVEDGPV